MEIADDDTVQLKQFLLLPVGSFCLMEHHRNVVEVAQAGRTGLFLQGVKVDGERMVFQGGVHEQGHALLQHRTCEGDPAQDLPVLVPAH